MNLIIFYVILHSSLFVTGKEQFLKFVPTLPSTDQQIYFQSPGTLGPIEVDATWPHQVRVRIVDFLNGDPELKIHCRIAPLDAYSELTFAGLCFKPNLQAQQRCIDPKDQIPQFGRVKFEFVGSRSEGYTFSSHLPVGTEPLDGYYSCRYVNPRGTIQSNMVEIQNAYYYHKRWAERSIDPTSRILTSFSAADLPLRLECGRPSPNELKLPHWADESFPSPFRWSFCDMSSTSDFSGYNCMVRLQSVRVSNYFEHTVFPNGTLYLLSRTPASWKHMALMCTSNARPNTIFSVILGGTRQDPRPLVFNSSIPYPTQRRIVPLSPLWKDVFLRRGPNDVTQLTAVYQADMNDLQHDWTKSNDRLPYEFVQSSPFSLTFPSNIHTNHSGLYVLRLNDGRSSLEFNFNVKVIGPPDVRVPPPPVLFVMEGTTAIFRCEIENYDSMSLKINGHDLLHGSQQSWNLIVERFPYLKDVNISPLRITDGSVMQYQASNLHFTTGSPFGPTHTVTIMASNKYGSATVSTLVAVLPHLRFIDAPAKYACGPPCVNTMKHTFDCKLDLNPYRRAHTVQTWDINGADVSTLSAQGDLRSDYLQVEGTKLHLLPVDDPSIVELFANSHAVCRLRIFSEPIPTTPGADTAIYAKSLVYDSREDTENLRFLTADIDLKVDTTVKPATASISWIAAVIIAIVLIIIIGALIACLVMRSRGETYLLDEEERALGNDPDKELREHEAFRTFERSDQPLLRGSRCSLNDDSAEIGSDADGELDDYNLDPGKFNEEGSFIDQYATETRYKGASRQPTLPRPQDT